MALEFLGRWAWPLVFAISWSFYWWVSNPEQFRRNWIGGVLFATRSIVFETYFTNRGFWEQGYIVFPSVPFAPKVDWFAILGPYFVLGLLVFQWLPWRQREKLVGYAIFWAVIGVAIDLIGVQVGLLRVSDAYQPLQHSFVTWLTWEGFIASKFFALELDTDQPVRPRSWQWVFWIGSPLFLGVCFLWTLWTLL